MENFYKWFFLFSFLDSHAVFLSEIFYPPKRIKNFAQKNRSLRRRKKFTDFSVIPTPIDPKCPFDKLKVRLFERKPVDFLLVKIR